MPHLTLYLAPGASSMAPHIALHEAGAQFDVVPLSFHKDDNKTPAFYALNPEGKVPLLLIDGRPLTEVAAILFYLAREFPAARLMPQADPESQAHVISWMSFVASSVHPARRQGLDHARAIYAIADGRLAGKEWCANAYSIADMHLFRLFWRFFNSLHPGRDEFPNLIAHYERMMARPAVRKTIEIESAMGYELPA